MILLHDCLLLITIYHLKINHYPIDYALTLDMAEEENKKFLSKTKTWEFVSQEGNCITFTMLAKIIPSIETADRLKQLLKNWNYIFSNGTVARRGYEQYYRPYIGKDRVPS